MVEYAVSDLVKEVKVLLDRNQESAGLLTPDDTDTLSQAELIESKIVDAASIILSDAPEDMVEGTACTNAVTWEDSNGYYVGKMILPTDMLRILSVKAETGHVLQQSYLRAMMPTSIRTANMVSGAILSDQLLLSYIRLTARVLNCIPVKSRMLRCHLSTFKFRLLLPKGRSVCLLF